MQDASKKMKMSQNEMVSALLLSVGMHEVNYRVIRSHSKNKKADFNRLRS